MTKRELVKKFCINSAAGQAIFDRLCDHNNWDKEKTTEFLGLALQGIYELFQGAASPALPEGLDELINQASNARVLIEAAVDCVDAGAKDLFEDTSVALRNRILQVKLAIHDKNKRVRPASEAAPR